RVRAHHVDEGWFTVDANELTGDDVELVCDRMLAVLQASAEEKARLTKMYGGGREGVPEFSWLS
ncbi:MAG: hypothetical protein VYB08_08215, partial [Candidatus Latescibacterota bacterium]|nr:hypothetical protein [Candidatus Latescibacterota bacterium]